MNVYKKELVLLGADPPGHTCSRYDGTWGRQMASPLRNVVAGLHDGGDEPRLLMPVVAMPTSRALCRCLLRGHSVWWCHRKLAEADVVAGHMIFEYRNVFMAPAAASLDVRSASRLFKALGDETRLRIVALLSHGELCVCHFESALDLTQSNTSRQLGVLKNAGIVEARRDGSWVYYRLAPQLDEVCKAQLKALVSAFTKRDVLREDVARLLKSRGPNACK
ncbi:metalloregulator ArsR/SmtB family transcription factor [Myxococcus sp. MISCRS1]|nr:metalloregulator ArsR/SmtB family transcription factor [Myxococcus sp. MISCRS1]MCY0998387.1 metalloregulator ArsR/SmtB family transcription factor [Myxococcus sp. MISCRS1]